MKDSMSKRMMKAAVFVMGHEFCGVITDPGDSDFKIGTEPYNGQICTAASAICALREKNSSAGK